MELVKWFLMLETVVIAMAAWRRNADQFSPVKLYLVYSTFFFSAIYLREVRWETLAIYALLVQSIALCLPFEKPQRGPLTIKRHNKPFVAFTTLWVLSLPAILTMLYFVYSAGGIREHLLSLALRVESWKGKGYLVVLLNTLPTLNLLYFAELVVLKRYTWISVGGFAVHFALFSIVGLLSGSRSFIAVSLLGMCVMWSYLVRPPKIRYVLSVAVIVIVFVGILGTVRNSGYDGNFIDNIRGGGTGGVKLENQQMGYGVDPLEIIYSSPEIIRMGGASYLTVFTNFIPRSLWPTKPETGGIVFTRLYTEDQTGLSYIATGAVAEGILNFGKNFGTLFGVLLNGAVLLFGCSVYNRMVSSSTASAKTIKPHFVVMYFYLILTCARFSYGEFTDLFQSLMFFSIIPLAIVNVVWRLRLTASQKGPDSPALSTASSESGVGSSIG